MTHRMILGATVALALGACAQYSDPYKVVIPEIADYNGSTAYLINYDTSEPIDSVVVTDGFAEFTGTVDEPFAARVTVNGQRMPVFVVEGGSMAYSHARNAIIGSPLNDQLKEISDSIDTYSIEMNAAPDDDAKQAVYDKLIGYVDGKMRVNADNPIGYLLFMDLAYEMEPKELVDFVEANPAMGNYTRVQKLVENNKKKAATGIGAKYVDYDIEGKKLSDYVGKDDKFLLVDYFASWCGPCVRQLPVLKELYAQYPDQLNILGVAVWDEPEASLRAIEQHQLPWECIINAGTIPTDLYGISGIPCIMLIAPDGTIVSRDLQGDELKAAVADALASAR